jgi:gliding motility-associated-like protein
MILKKYNINKMKKYNLKQLCLFLAAMAFLPYLSAQVTVGSITPVLVGSTGNFSSAGGFMISSSTGEPMVPTASSGNYIITQGFQQPSPNGTLALNANLVYANSSCMGSNDAFASVTPVGGSGPYTYVWSSGDTLANADSLTPGTYTVTVTDAGGLNLTQTFSVADGTGICGIQPYSGLTSNGDGHNDLWIIDYIDLHMPNTVTIYNRWGMMVWKGDNYDNSTVVWNGAAQDGSVLPDGTYFYTIEVTGGHMESWVELSH